MDAIIAIGSSRRRAAALVCTAVLSMIGMVATNSASASSGVFAWGENSRGQLGNGTTERSDVPVPVSGLNGGASAVAGGEAFSLALLANGTVMAWGENGFGQLGDGTTEGMSDVPVPVSGLGEVAMIAAGGNHSLALLSNETVVAWGYNAFGQLGNGTTISSDLPVPVSGLSEVTAIAAGANYSLALLRDGTVMAWGSNESGELGDGSTTQSDKPVPVSGLAEVSAIAAGNGVSTALLQNGTVVDWGYNGQGQLGDGSEGSVSTVPVAVSGLTAVVGMPNGGESMALLSGGTVMDWGLNGSGQLGNGVEGGGSNVPVKVSGLSGATAIAGGLEHRLALLGDGSVVAWGNGSSGQLGNGVEGTSAIPVSVNGLTGMTAIAAGKYFSLAAGSEAAGPAPSIATMKPNHGPTTGGTTVAIRGRNLSGATSVKFGTTDAATFVVHSPTSITAVSPAGLSGTVDVTVTTPGGISPISRHDRFRFH